MQATAAISSFSLQNIPQTRSFLFFRSSVGDSASTSEAKKNEIVDRNLGNRQEIWEEPSEILGSLPKILGILGIPKKFGRKW